MILLLWKFAVGAIAGFALAWLIQLQVIHGIEARDKEALVAQTKFDISQCAESQKPTEEGNDQYQKIIAARDARIAELSKRPARCIYVSKSADSAKAPEGKHGNGNGLPDSVLLKYAGFCEAYRGSTETLYDFNGKVRCKLK